MGNEGVDLASALSPFFLFLSGSRFYGSAGSRSRCKVR